MNKDRKGLLRKYLEKDSQLLPLEIEGRGGSEVGMERSLNRKQIERKN